MVSFLITEYIEESELLSIIDRLIDESSDTKDQNDSFESTDTAEVTGGDNTENTGPSTSDNSNKQRRLLNWLNLARKTSSPRASGFIEKAQREIEI